MTPDVEDTLAQNQRPPLLAAVGNSALVTALVILGALFAAGSVLINPWLFVLGCGVAIAFVLSRTTWGGFTLLYIGTNFSGYRYHYANYTFRSDQVILVIVLFSWLIHFMRGRARIHHTILDIPIIGLLSVGLLSTVLYSSNPESFQSLFLQLVYATMFFYTANALLDNKEKIDTAIKFVMIVAFVHVVYAQLALGSFLAGVDIGGMAPSGLLSNWPLTRGFLQESDLMGAYAGIMMIMFATHLLNQNKQKIFNQRFLIAGLMLLLFTAVTSFARAAWLGLGAGIVLMIFYARPRRNVINTKTVAFMAIILVLSVAVVYPVVNFAFSKYSGQENILLKRVQDVVNFESGSGEGRVRIQQLALERWREQPFLGYGVLALTYEDAASVGSASPWLYSTVISSMHDTGIVGLTFMLWIHIVPIVYTIKAAGKVRNTPRYASLMGFVLGDVVLVIASQASSFFWLGFPWIYLGVMVAAAKITMDESREQTSATLEPVVSQHG